jgi:hypothetical protein
MSRRAVFIIFNSVISSSVSTLYSAEWLDDSEYELENI